MSNLETEALRARVENIQAEWEDMKDRMEQLRAALREIADREPLTAREEVSREIARAALSQSPKQEEGR